MKIYVVHSTGFDYANELYAPLRGSALNSVHEIVLPHEHSTEQADARSILETTDVVLAEVSYPSTGMGIELGFAYDMQVPIVCIHRIDTAPSAALKAVSGHFFEYAHPGALAETVARALSTL